MTFKAIILRLFKSVSFWITISILFGFIILHSVVYFNKSREFDRETNLVTLKYENLDDLKQLEKDIEKEIKIEKAKKSSTIINVLEIEKNVVKTLIKNPHIKSDDYYFRTSHSFSLDRYDYLSSSTSLVFVLMVVAVLITTYRVFGEDFNTERSYMLVYHNNNRIPQLLKRMGIILLVSFALTTLFSFVIGMISFTFKQSHGYVIYNFVEHYKAFRASSYYFVYFYLVNIFNMLLIYFVFTSVFLLSLRKVLSSFIALILSLVFIFYTFMPLLNRYKEYTQPVFGNSDYGLTYQSSVIIKLAILLILGLIFLGNILYFKKRDLN